MPPSWAADQPRAAQVGAAHVADEQGVAGENGLRVGICGRAVVNDDGDRFGCVAGGFQYFQAHAAEFESVAIAVRNKRVRRFGGGAEMDGCADAIAQLQMPGDEIGVEMGQEYVLDLQGMLRREGNIVIRVALRVDDDGGTGLLVADDVRGVGEAGKIELLEDHEAPPPFVECSVQETSRE